MTEVSTTQDSLTSKNSTWSFGKLSSKQSTVKSHTLSTGNKKKRSIVIADDAFFDEKLVDQEKQAPAETSAVAEQNTHLSAVLNNDAWEISVAERRQATKKSKASLTSEARRLTKRLAE
jgi:hypothetical protein